MEALPLLLLLAAAFYLLIVRPTQLRNRRAADLKANLKPGVEIITTSGLVGRVQSVDDDEIKLELAPGVIVRLLTGAVGKILAPDDASTGDGEQESDSDSPPPKSL